MKKSLIFGALMIFSCLALLFLFLFRPTNQEQHTKKVTNTGPIHPQIKENLSAPENQNGQGKVTGDNQTPTPTENSKQQQASLLQTAWGKFQTGDYDGAVEILWAQQAAFPNNAEIKNNLATSLFALAIQKVKLQQWTEAEKLLEQSSRLGNKDATKALANIKLKLGNTDLASGLFETLLDQTLDQAQDPESLKVLVDISLRTDNLDRAEYFLNKLEQTDPWVWQKKQRLELKRAFAQTQDTFVTTNGIEVASEAGTPRIVVAKVARAMEDTLNELSSALLGTPQQFRFKAYLFKKDSFAQTTEAPMWAGGLFDGQINLPVAKQAFQTVTAQSAALGSSWFDRSQNAINFIADDLARVARHEMTHAYLYAFCGDTIPAWLGEGMAQRAEGRPESSVFLELKKRGENFKTTPIEGLDGNFIGASADTVGRLYAQSYFLVKSLAENLSLQDLQRHSTRQKGFSNFKGLLQRTCLGKETIPFALQSEFGAPSASELWGLRLQQP